MASERKHIQRKHENIKKMFMRMREIRDKKFGKRKYTDERILAEVAAKFYVAEKTVLNVVFAKVPPEAAPNNQIDLFQIIEEVTSNQTPTDKHE